MSYPETPENAEVTAEVTADRSSMGGVNGRRALLITGAVLAGAAAFLISCRRSSISCGER